MRRSFRTQCKESYKKGIKAGSFLTTLAMSSWYLERVHACGHFTGRVGSEERRDPVDVTESSGAVDAPRRAGHGIRGPEAGNQGSRTPESKTLYYWAKSIIAFALLAL